LRDFIQLEINTGEILTFLVDTQADVSLIKIEAANTINEYDKIQLRGITDESIETNGTTRINLVLPKTLIEHKFHVVDNDFPIPSDGIIGKDFMQHHFCKIDYYDMEFTIRKENHDVIIPIHGGPKTNLIAVPPRCEVFRTFRCDNIDETSFVENKEIAPGIFIANTVIYGKYPMIRVINTTEKIEIIPNFIKAEPLRTYDIYNIKDAGDDSKRIENLNKIFRKNTPSNKLHLIEELGKEYSDIFTLDTDKMSINNFYEQKIRIIDDTLMHTRKK